MITAKIDFYNAVDDVALTTVNPTKSYNLVDFHMCVSKKHNLLEPMSNARCEVVEIKLVAPDPKDLFMYEWFLNQEKKVLTIGYAIVKDDLKTRRIVCDSAQCFSIKESYDSASHQQRYLILQFETKTLTLSVDNDSSYTQVVFNHL